jgi:hypothetical protein
LDIAKQLEAKLEKQLGARKVSNKIEIELHEQLQQAQDERDALVRWVKTESEALRWFQTSPSREEYKIAKAEMVKAWQAIPEATRKEIEDVA